MINGGGYGTGVDTSLDVAVSVVSICHSGDETNSTWTAMIDYPIFSTNPPLHNLHLEKERYLLTSIKH